MRSLLRRVLGSLILIAVLVGCNDRIVPTPASIGMVLTTQYQTQNAPPAGYSTVSFPQIDANLEKLTNWHYTVSLEVDGIYSGTSNKAQGTLSAEIYRNELIGERRVILTISGDPFGIKDKKERRLEGVRIGNTFYFVDQNKACKKAIDPTDQNVALLTAGGLIGGIKEATHGDQHKTINNMAAWQYTFLPDQVNAPPLQLGDNGKIGIASGDLWVTPSRNAVVDYTLTLVVENASIQGSLPLSGQVRSSYHLLETGVAYNISIPYGC